MKYFIPVSGKLTEVSEAAYEFWAESEQEKYILPPFSITNGDRIFNIGTMYVGAIDEGEEPLPFILLYLEDSLALLKRGNGIKSKLNEDKFEYFSTFDELQLHRQKLIEGINLILKHQ